MNGIRLNSHLWIQFFDRSIFKKNWRLINETPLKKSGLLVRKIARQSIRHRRGTSKPGTPPRSHAPGKPMKAIFSVPDSLGRYVIIGEVHLGSRPPVPGIHEHGGMAIRKVFTRGNTWHSNQKRLRMRVTYPMREYMAPALSKAVPKLPFFWNQSLSSP